MRVRQLHRRRRIEDGGDAGGPGDLQPADRRVERLLELGDEDRGRADQLGIVVDVLRRDQRGRARRDDDRVVAGALLQEDVGRAGIALGRHGDRRLHAGVLPGLHRHVGERVLAEPRDEGDVRAELAAGHRLVGALAARTEREAGAEQRFAHARLALRVIGGVGDEDAEDDDRLWPSAQSASGGMTPLRKAKQP